MNPILEKHPEAKEYVLFGAPEIDWSYTLTDAEDGGRSEGWWGVWVDYAPDTRCGFDGDCRCKELFHRGFDSHDEAVIFAGILVANAKEIR